MEKKTSSKTKQKYNIAILIPEDLKEFIHEEIQLKDSELQTSEKFVLQGKEMNEDLNFVSSTCPFEFTLFNDKEKVKFINEVN